MIGPFTFVLLLVSLLFIVPIWIFFNFLAKTRSNKLLSTEDEKILEDLWKMAKKMEERIITLESILEKDK